MSAPVRRSVLCAGVVLAAVVAAAPGLSEEGGSFGSSTAPAVAGRTPADNGLTAIPATIAGVAEATGGLITEAPAAREKTARTPLNQPQCTVCLVGNASTSWYGTTGSFHVDSIENYRSSGVSGPLDVRIALTASQPVWGQSIQYYSFSGAVSFNPLTAGYMYSPVDSGTIPFSNSIPAGQYFLLMYMRENVSGTYYYADWIQFPQKVSCTGSGCVNVPSAPVVDFSSSPTSPVAGQVVQFTDTSTNTPTSWSWTFGDGGSSSSQNPTHTYASAGTYSVSLTASNAGGSGSNTKSVAVGSSGGGGSCVEDALTACLISGRYRVTGRWKNQYAGGAAANLNKAKLTDATNAFWIADASTYEFVIRINTATDNGRAWITILTFTSVEFWVNVVDTKGQHQTFEYHSAPGNTTLIYDPFTFVYP